MPQSGKIKEKQYQTIWKNNNFLRSGNIFDSVKVSEKSGNSIFIAHIPYLLKGVKDFKMETNIGGLQKEQSSKCKKGFLFNISHLIQGL